MADLINKSYSTYQKKENGDIAFTQDEIVTIANDLQMNLLRTNCVFFSNKLPNGNSVQGDCVC